MPRKTRLDNGKRRRRNPKDEQADICEMDDISVAMPRYLSDKTETTIAAAIFDVVANPDKYKHLQEKP